MGRRSPGKGARPMGAASRGKVSHFRNRNPRRSFSKPSHFPSESVSENSPVPRALVASSCMLWPSHVRFGHGSTLDRPGRTACGPSPLSRQLVRDRGPEPPQARGCARRGLPGARSLLRAAGPGCLLLRQGLPEGDRFPVPAPGGRRDHEGEGGPGEYPFRRGALRRDRKKALSRQKALNSRPHPTFPTGLNRAIGPVPACRRRACSSSSRSAR